MSDQDNRDIRIDIVSDVVCPWCIVGYKQLERALELTGTTAEIRWHPFELNPQLSDEGQDLQEHLEAKYGMGPEDNRRGRERLTAIGDELGFSFRYGDDMRMVPTFRAHQLLHWADTQDRRHPLKLALFHAYFTDQGNVNDPEVLAEVAASVGLDRAAALSVLADGRYESAVREDERSWTLQGVRAVPAMVFDERQAVLGAQGVDTYIALLRELGVGRQPSTRDSRSHAAPD